nr:unnamed protein product [Callosobruchus analis]
MDVYRGSYSILKRLLLGCPVMEEDECQFEEAYQLLCYCGKRYRTKCDMRFHQKFECGKEPQFSCRECHRTFHRKANLKVHYYPSLVTVESDTEGKLTENTTNVSNVERNLNFHVAYAPSYVIGRQI